MVAAILAVAPDELSVAETDAAVRPHYVGRPVEDVLIELREAGLAVAWSSRLITPRTIVVREPVALDAASIAAEILAPHGLALKEDAGLLLVVRDRSTASPATATRADNPTQESEPEIETIVVSASRYEVSRDVAISNFVLDQQMIQEMPDVGEDPVRITHRLPGAAASGASARAHFRGGEQGEVGIVLNGQRLFDPFHVRDYQNVFSAIDSRAVRGVEVYTGGFPVRYGDRMSGLVLMESIDPADSQRTEIGLSVFNTSVLHAGGSETARWLFSARRGNLDLVINPEFGRPSYWDTFSQLEIDVTPDMTLSANAFYAEDRVSVILESDPAEREQATSRTRNAQFWVSLENRWSDQLTSSTLLSATDYSNRRNGEVNDPEKLIGTVSDDRDVSQFGFRQDWSYRRSDDHLLQWGLSITGGTADYRYLARADYFGLPAAIENQPASVARELSAQPSGASYALYYADRWKFGEATVFEWGLRWDDQTYTGLASDAQLSPRVSVLRSLSEKTDLRLSWGRYHQSQGIHELQIEDGIGRYWPAQRADHLIAGLTHRISDGVSMRVEGFHKDFRDVRPRFENLYDPLSLLPELQPDRVRLDPTSATASGIEISLDGEHRNWAWWTSYTASRVTDRIAGADVVRSWDQRSAVQAGLRWSSNAWQLSAAVGAHTGWPTTDLVLEERGVDSGGQPVIVAVPGERNALRHNTFASLDARLSRRFDVRYGSLLVFVEVSNLTDRHNVCCVDWDLEEDPGGNLVLEKSDDSWLPILPAVGILWEF